MSGRTASHGLTRAEVVLRVQASRRAQGLRPRTRVAVASYSLVTVTDAQP